MSKNRISISYTKKLFFLWSLLPKKMQKQTFILFFLILLGTIFETLGIGMVIPLIAIMIDDNITDKLPLIAPIMNWLGNPTQNILMVYGMLCLAFIYCLKALFLSFLAYIQAKYVFNIKAFVTNKLFETYLDEPYKFHISNNSSQLIRNLITETQQLISNVLIPCLILTSELVLILLLMILLTFFQPVGFTIVFVICGVAIFIFNRLTKSFLKNWGQERQVHEGCRIKSAQESLGAIKDIKLLGRENTFKKDYMFHTVKTTSVERKQFFLRNLPRLYLETLAIIGASILVIFVVYRTGSVTDALTTVALFSAAAFRMLPSANRVLTSTQSLRYAETVIDLVARELSTAVKKRRSVDFKLKKIALQKSIEVRDLSFSYFDSKKIILKNINLRINRGECIGIIGKSGSGKTTLVDLMLGLLKPTNGAIFVDGIDIEDNKRAWQNSIGYVQQNIFLTDDTIRKNIALGVEECEVNEELVDYAIKSSQLNDFTSNLSNGKNTRVGEMGVQLSGGQRQRIGIARALYHNPPILVFDEATSSLDNETEYEILEEIRSLKRVKTMIIVAHRMSTIKACDKIIKIENNHLTQLD